MRELFWGLFDVWNHIQELSWQISIIILLVLICRLFIGKVSKQASYFLWGIVAIRLLFPVMPESDFSIFNAINEELFSKMTITEEITLPETPMQENTGPLIHSGSENVTIVPDITVGDVLLDTIKPDNIPDINELSNQNNVNGMTYSDIASEQSNFWKVNLQFIVWLAGACILSIYGVLSYGILHYKLRFATSSDHKIYEAEHISSPFVYGLIKPRIYLPYHLTEEEKDYVLRHEKYHIKRKDYLAKILAFGLLAVYWFHPLVWVAYYLMSRDMEASCDEQVLKELGIEERKAYSTLLLSFACEKRIPLPSPVSFGENDIKSRIKGILNYKKPTFWSLIGIFVLSIALVLGCLTDAKNDPDADELQETNEESVEKLAKTLYDLKTPYIGDAVTNGKIFKAIFEELGISGQNGMELQTRMEPYWISLSFVGEQNTNKLWQASAMYLALVENANEVRFSYCDEYGSMETYYVTTDSVNAYMEGRDIKECTSSAEEIITLWEMLEQKRLYATYATANVPYANILVSSTNWDNRATKAGMDFTERIEWENRLISDDILYRGEEGYVVTCMYEDFDQSGKKDLIVVIRDQDWEDDIIDRFYIYMNEEPVYVHEISYRGAFWNVTVCDIDNDGYLEFLFYGDSGGTGGYGFNAIYELLKYKNETFEVMPLPKDEFLEANNETTGFGVEVYTAEGEGNYIAYCPALDKSIPFSIGNEHIDDFEVGILANTLVGREYYGFHKLIPVSNAGKNYLLAEECLYRSNIYNRVTEVATAQFLLRWDDESKNWAIENFEVIPYRSINISTDEFALAEECILYKNEDPFQDEMTVDLVILNKLQRYYDIHDASNIRPKTIDSPQWITLMFSEKPDDTAMWKLASVFLALSEKYEELRWEFTGENGTLYTYYVHRDDVEAILKQEDLTKYAVSPEMLVEFMQLLEKSETTVTKPTNDAGLNTNKHLSYSLFSHYVQDAGVPWEIAIQYETRLIEDGIVYRNDESKTIYDSIYQDFDNSGTMDFAIYIGDEDAESYAIYLYMNDDPLYTCVLPMKCLDMKMIFGDIDHDGAVELIYSGDNGGVGSANGEVKGILKYKNHTFTQMDMPGDFTEEVSWGDAGYHMDVYWGEKEDTYVIVCETLGIRETIHLEYLKNDDGSYIIPSEQGELVGANCLGFYNMNIIAENGRDYLVADEAFYGECGASHKLGYMRFVFDWDVHEGWLVKDVSVHIDDSH